MSKTSESIYCKTLKTSETGLKFQEIEKREKECLNAVIALGDELGFKSWRPGYWSAYGGVSACIFPDGVTPDPKVWKKVNGDEYMPRLNCKEGKELHKKFEALPRVGHEELNMCIGFDAQGPFYCIGFAPNNDTYYGFIVGANWGCKIPDDCTEVTYTEYQTLFGKKQKEN